MTFSSRPGAVTDADGVVTHYGTLFAEQRALAAGGVVARDDLGVLALTGSERLSWLDSISSQAVATLAPGESTETLILDPQGHIEQVFHLVDDGVTTWLVTPMVQLESAAAWLTKMRFRADVAIRDASEERAVIAQFGQIAVDLAAFDAVAWRDPWPGVLPGGSGYANAPADWPAIEWLVPRVRVNELIGALDAARVPIAGVLGWHALRIAAGRPERTDVDDRSLPHEFDWLRTAVHLSKGCYRGQETVAKVHNLGRPPRRLVRLLLDGSESISVAPGDSVWASKAGEPREVGVLTATGQHWEWGPIALALVKRALPDSEPVTVHHDGESVPATQEVLVPSEAGPAVSVPRIPRLGSRS